jgi:hypothetical protein
MPNKQLENFRFEPIRGYRVFEDVLDQLTYVIRSGVYEPGDRLPDLELMKVTSCARARSIGRRASSRSWTEG